MNIYDFIANPWESVKAGYRPCYLDCVSATSHRWGDVFKSLWSCGAEIRDVLDMTIREIVVWLVQVVFMAAVTATWPVGIWFWGYIQYANIKHYVAGLEEDLE